MTLQEKIDACWRLANDPGATPEERETAKRFAEKLEAKLKGQDEAKTSGGSFWTGDSDEWFTGQHDTIYEAVDEFLRNAKNHTPWTVPIGIHVPSLDRQFVAMGRCEYATHVDLIRSPWGNMPGFAESNVRVEFGGRDVTRVAPLVQALFHDMLTDVLVVARRGDGLWLNCRGFIREARMDSDMGLGSSMTLDFVANEIEFSDHIVKPKPRELPPKPNILPGPR